jgi:hypothetical protein
LVTIRCTAKLLSRTGLHAEPVALTPTAALGDWHANILFFHRAQVLLFVSDASLLAVVTPAREVRALASHLTQGLSVLLEHLGAPPTWIDWEVREMAEARFAPTRSRGVLATMNNYKIQIEGRFHEWGSVYPLEMSLDLSQCPAGPLQYRLPVEVALDLLRQRHDGASLV